MTRITSAAFAALAALFLFAATAAARDCSWTLTVADPHETGFAAAAEDKIRLTLAANNCLPAAEGETPILNIVFTINSLTSDRDVNAVGMLFAGGFSSATKLDAAADATLDADAPAGHLSLNGVFGNGPHEYFSGWRRARGVKKRAVELAAEKLTLELLAGLDPEVKTVAPSRPNSDFLNEDADLWPILAGGAADIVIHESAHYINARLLGHRTHFRGNDKRTFKVGPHTPAGISVLFTHHVGDNQLLMIPDMLYDFTAVETPAGLEYRDENGNLVSNGARDHAFIAWSGIMSQQITNEYILTKHPRLIDEDEPLLKGMFLFNIFIPAFYTFESNRDENSDLRLLRRDLDINRGVVNSMVLVPAALDVYRYYHPEKKRLRLYSRIAKIIPVAVCLSQ